MFYNSYSKYFFIVVNTNIINYEKLLYLIMILLKYILNIYKHTKNRVLRKK